MHRRMLLGWLASAGAGAGASSGSGSGSGAGAGADVGAGAAAARTPLPPESAPLRFPRDFGAHPETRTEWWYVTGGLQAGPRLWGFQVTFFRVSTGVAAPLDHAKLDHPPIAGAKPSVASTPARTAAAAAASRFAPTQLLFAHAALTDLEGRRLRHDQRIARAGFGIAQAGLDDTAVSLRDWRLARSPQPARAGASRYRAQVASESGGFSLALQFDATQPVLLQGEAGLSRKGPAAAETSRYYSEPQLDATGTLTLDGRAHEVRGRAWLDHEWSDAFIPAGAVGWDWIGMNLDDGSALTAFRLRRADGSAAYAGGSLRRSVETLARNFAADEVRFTPGRVWASPATRARYPVQWLVETPAGRFGVNALLDDQELDSRASTGAVYWEGLSELVDAVSGRPLGRGYLEMTGYAAALRL